MEPAVPRLHSLNLKYVDDLSMLCALSLKSCLLDDPVDRPRPLNFDERTGQILDMSNNQLQRDLEILHEFTSRKQLKIKEKKTQIMKFNFSKTHDFPPEFKIPGFHDMLEQTRETKLLGVMITSDLKWEANTQYICAKAFKKIWILRRMKKVDVKPLDILEVYMKEIRSILELAVPAWHSGLTVKQAADIERVQRVAVAIILSDYKTGKCEMSYSMALVTLDLEPLDMRRDKLCMNFAKKTLKSRHADMFQLNPNQHDTRNKPRFANSSSNTKRFYNSPLNYLTRVLNDT